MLGRTGELGGQAFESWRYDERMIVERCVYMSSKKSIIEVGKKSMSRGFERVVMSSNLDDNKVIGFTMKRSNLDVFK